MRAPNFFDQLISHVDITLRTLLPPQNRTAQRPYPAQHLDDNELSLADKKHIAGLMRVNHAGEVCAQGLYQGQALTAKLTHVREQMQHSAEEEIDHLAWCEQRLRELNSQPSIFNLIWYPGSVLLGAIAGLAGDPYSLGFVAETEHQVTAHLKHHVTKLPIYDIKTRTILEQMTIDETHHAELAISAGATELPPPIQKTMRLVSKIMTNTSYYV